MNNKRDWKSSLRRIFPLAAGVVLSVTIGRAETVFLLKTSASVQPLKSEEMTLRRKIRGDKSLADLAKRLGFSLKIRQVGREYYLVGGPVSDGFETALFAWKLRTLSPEAIALTLPVSPTQITSYSSSVAFSSDEELSRLWIALFALALIAVLGLYVSSQQLRKLQKRFAKMKRSQEEIEKQLSGFLTKVSEEIYSMSKEANTQLGKLVRKKKRESLDENLKQVMQIENKILDNSMHLLNFLRLKAHKITLREEPFDLNTMLGDVLTALRERIAPSDKELIFDLERDLPRKVKGDFSHSIEVLSNLLEEALVNTRGEDVQLSLSAFRPYTEQGELRFRIAYLAAEDDAFDPETFFVPQRDEETGEYRNMGLYVAKELSELMGGTLRAGSAAGGHLRLLDLMLPLASAEKEGEQRRYHLPERELTRKEILVVTRNEITSEALRKLFAYYRHRVTLMNFAQFESKHPSLERFDLVVLDETLIDDPFVEYVRTLQKERDVRIVALHNLFQPPRLLPEDVVSATLGKPATLLDVYNLIVDLYAPRKPVKNEESHLEEEGAQSRTFHADFPAKEGVTLKDFRHFAGTRLLIVEDNPLNLKMILKVLEGSGIRIETAENGLKAVESVERHSAGSFDLVLMDINMPVMDGYQATRLIRQSRSGAELPIVALSALNLENEIQRMREAGMDGYLPKPIDLGKLYTAFATYLEAKKVPLGLEEEKRSRTPVSYHTIDYKKALQYCSGNATLLEEILESFVDAYGESDRDLRRLLQRREYEEMRKVLLDLLGISGTIAAEDLHKRVKAFYRDILLHRFDDLPQRLEEYSSALKALCEEIRRKRS